MFRNCTIDNKELAAVLSAAIAISEYKAGDDFKGMLNKAIKISKDNMGVDLKESDLISLIRPEMESRADKRFFEGYNPPIPLEEKKEISSGELADEDGTPLLPADPNSPVGDTNIISFLRKVGFPISLAANMFDYMQERIFTAVYVSEEGEMVADSEIDARMKSLKEELSKKYHEGLEPNPKFFQLQDPELAGKYVDDVIARYFDYLALTMFPQHVKKKGDTWTGRKRKNIRENATFDDDAIDGLSEMEDSVSMFINTRRVGNPNKFPPRYLNASVELFRGIQQAMDMTDWDGVDPYQGLKQALQRFEKPDTETLNIFADTHHLLSALQKSLYGANGILKKERKNPNPFMESLVRTLVSRQELFYIDQVYDQETDSVKTVFPIRNTTATSDKYEDAFKLTAKEIAKEGLTAEGYAERKGFSWTSDDAKNTAEIKFGNSFIRKKGNKYYAKIDAPQGTSMVKVWKELLYGITGVYAEMDETFFLPVKGEKLKSGEVSSQASAFPDAIFSFMQSIGMDDVQKEKLYKKVYRSLQSIARHYDVEKGSISKSTRTNVEGKQEARIGLQNTLMTLRRHIRRAKNAGENSANAENLYVKEGGLSVEYFAIKGGLSVAGEPRKNAKMSLAETFVFNYKAYWDSIKEFGSLESGSKKAIFDYAVFSDKSRNSMPLINSNGDYTFGLRDDINDTREEALRAMLAKTYLAQAEALLKPYRTLAAFDSAKHRATRDQIAKILKTIKGSEAQKFDQLKGIFEALAKLDENSLLEMTKSYNLKNPSNPVQLYKDVHLGKKIKGMSKDISADEEYGSDNYMDYLARLVDKKAFKKMLENQFRKNFMEPITSELGGSLDILGEYGNEEMMRAYFVDWIYAGNPLLFLTQGSQFQYAPNMSDGFIKQLKRNVSLQSTIHPYSINAPKGVREYTYTAVIADPTQQLANALGNFKMDQDAFDGAGFVSMSYFMKEQNSLGSLSQGKVSKPLLTSYDHDMGVMQFQKLAVYPIGGESMRKSVELEKLLFRMMNSAISRDAWSKITDEEKAKLQAFASKKADYVKLLPDGTVEQIDLKKLLEPNMTHWKALQILGGKHAAVRDPRGGLKGKDGQNYRYADNAFSMLLDLEAEIGSVYGMYPEKAVLASATKTGIANINGNDKYWSEDIDDSMMAESKQLGEESELNFMRFSNVGAGIQLNAEHDTDGGQLTLPTQVINALAFGGRTPEYTRKVGDALLRLSMKKMEEILKVAKGDNAYNGLSQMFKEIIQSAMAGKDAGPKVLSLAEALIQRDNVPYSSSQLVGLLYSTIGSHLSKLGVRFKLQGGQQVAVPDSYGVYVAEDTATGAMLTLDREAYQRMLAQGKVKEGRKRRLQQEYVKIGQLYDFQLPFLADIFKMNLYEMASNANNDAKALEILNMAFEAPDQGVEIKYLSDEELTEIQNKQSFVKFEDFISVKFKFDFPSKIEIAKTLGRKLTNTEDNIIPLFGMMLSEINTTALLEGSLSNLISENTRRNLLELKRTEGDWLKPKDKRLVPNTLTTTKLTKETEELLLQDYLKYLSSIGYKKPLIKVPLSEVPESIINFAKEAFVEESNSLTKTTVEFAKKKLQEWSSYVSSRIETYRQLGISENLISELSTPSENYTWARTALNNYEVSSAGDTRFSAFYAQLNDGRYIEDIYQLDIKGNGVAVSKPKADIQNPVKSSIKKTGEFKRKISREDSWNEYKALWKQYFSENPQLLEEIKTKALGKTITDRFASTDVSQARAIAEILNETSTKFKSQKEQADVLRGMYREYMDNLAKGATITSGENGTRTAYKDGQVVFDSYPAEALADYVHRSKFGIPKGMSPAEADLNWFRDRFKLPGDKWAEAKIWNTVLGFINDGLSPEAKITQSKLRKLIEGKSQLEEGSELSTNAEYLKLIEDSKKPEWQVLGIRSLFNEQSLTQMGDEAYENFQKSLEVDLARIPAQSFQSDSGSKIVGFIESMANVTIEPIESLWRKGQDHDIDKSNMFGYSFNRDGSMDLWNSSMDNRMGESWEVDADDSASEMGLMNYLYHNIRAATLDPRNRFLSQFPVDMDEMHDAKKDTPKNKMDKSIHALSPFSHVSMKHANMVGKDVIGIAAVIQKVFSAVTWSVQQGGMDFKKAKYASLSIMWNGELRKFANVDSAKALESFLESNERDPYVIDSFFGKNKEELEKIEQMSEGEEKTLAIQKLSSELRMEMNLEPSADLIISQLISAATDNAKELILGKMNLGVAMAPTAGIMMMYNINIKEIAKLFTSPEIEEVSKRSAKNGYMIGESFVSIISVAENMLEDAKTEVEKDNLKKFIYFSKQAEAFTSLGRVLGINQGAPTDMPTAISYFRGLEDYINGLYAKAKKDSESMKKESPEDLKYDLGKALSSFRFELPRFIEAVMDSRSSDINEQRSGKASVEEMLKDFQAIREYYRIQEGIPLPHIPYILNSNPQYAAQINAAVATMEIAGILTYGTRTVFRMMDLVQKAIPSLETRMSLKDWQVKRLSKVMDDLVIDRFFQDNPFSFHNAGKSFFISGPEGRYNFVRYMEQYFIPALKAQRELSGNEFLRDYLRSSKMDRETGEEITGYSLLMDSSYMPTERQKLAYFAYQEGLRDLEYVSMDGNNALQMLMLYNLVVHRQSIGQGSFTKLLDFLVLKGNAEGSLQAHNPSKAALAMGKWLDYQAEMGANEDIYEQLVEPIENMVLENLMVYQGLAPRAIRRWDDDRQRYVLRPPKDVMFYYSNEKKDDKYLPLYRKKDAKGEFKELSPKYPSKAIPLSSDRFFSMEVEPRLQEFKQIASGTATFEAFIQIEETKKKEVVQIKEEPKKELPKLGTATKFKDDKGNPVWEKIFESPESFNEFIDSTSIGYLNNLELPFSREQLEEKFKLLPCIDDVPF